MTLLHLYFVNESGDWNGQEGRGMNILEGVEMEVLTRRRRLRGIMLWCRNDEAQLLPVYVKIFYGNRCVGMVDSEGMDGNVSADMRLHHSVSLFADKGEKISAYIVAAPNGHYDPLSAWRQLEVYADIEELP